MPARLSDGQSIVDQHVAFQTATATESSGTADDLKGFLFFFVFIDTPIAALDERFGKATCEVLNWMAVFTPKKWKEETSVQIRNLSQKHDVPYSAVTEYIIPTFSC